MLVLRFMEIDICIPQNSWSCRIFWCGMGEQPMKGIERPGSLASSNPTIYTNTCGVKKRVVPGSLSHFVDDEILLSNIGSLIPAIPIPSMYGISIYIWSIFVVNVGKYTIIHHTWMIWDTLILRDSLLDDARRIYLRCSGLAHADVFGKPSARSIMPMWLWYWAGCGSKLKS